MVPQYKKALGQHHLRDPRLCRPALEFLTPTPAVVLEIGPGGGVLTDPLLQRGTRVIAWEIDPAWAMPLATARRSQALSTVVGDATTIAWDRLPKGVAVAGNLPFQVATAIVLQLLDHTECWDRAALMVQREVADRITASPGVRPYGALSVLVQHRVLATKLGTVRRTRFHPPPAVDGTFVGLRPRPVRETPQEWLEYRSLVHLAFASPRKTLRNNLRRSTSDAEVEGWCRRAEIDPNQRPGTLSAADFARLLEQKS